MLDALSISVVAEKRDVDDVSSLENTEDKRAIFRYGKRAPLFRYGKRLFRYGKRSDIDTDEADDMEMDKRLFRYGRQDSDIYKRLFRYGKRADSFEDLYLDEPSKRLFRYGKREDPLFFPHNEDSTNEKRLFRYGRSDLASRAASQDPHVPFRFGERE